MVKKITAAVLVIIMAFSCMFSASAALIQGSTKEASAINSAKAAYLKQIEGAQEGDEYYNAFTVTRSVEKTDEDGKKYSEVTVRSKYTYKYTCDVYYYSASAPIIGVIAAGYYTEMNSGRLETTDLITGIIGTIFEQIMALIAQYISV